MRDATDDFAVRIRTAPPRDAHQPSATAVFIDLHGNTTKNR
jgi:hypothetical protein